MSGNQVFVETVWGYYQQHGRDLPWRQGSLRGYPILVSELMLQQTQVGRVVPKYQAFLQQFPTIKALAAAPLADVLRTWSGLGYNRRAKYLHEAAKQLAGKKEPWTLEDLILCRGIGHNTAAAVITYAYNQPTAFIETNVRTVYIHHFFATGSHPIADTDILPLVEETLDQEHPREFMWALMDYGSFLKSSVGNAARYSKHHTTQSKFEGSLRQIRGQVLRSLGENSRTLTRLQELIPDERLHKALEQLSHEGLIQKNGRRYQLAN